MAGSRRGYAPGSSNDPERNRDRVWSLAGTEKSSASCLRTCTGRFRRGTDRSSWCARPRCRGRPWGRTGSAGSARWPAWRIATAVSGRLRELDHERRVVRRRDAADRVGLPGAVVVEAFDHGVVERVSAGARLRVRLALDRADEVSRRDRHVLERRRVVDVRLDRERVRQTIARDRRERRREIGLQFVAALFGRQFLRLKQRAKEAALEVFERELVVLLLRVERRRDVARLCDVQRPPRLTPLPRRQSYWSAACCSCCTRHPRWRGPLLRRSIARLSSCHTPL